MSHPSEPGKWYYYNEETGETSQETSIFCWVNLLMTCEKQFRFTFFHVRFLFSNPTWSAHEIFAEVGKHLEVALGGEGNGW